MDIISSVLPASLSPGLSLWLILLSAICSFITASFGIGGGLLLLTVLSLTLPLYAIIPVHAVIQWGSNTGRMLMAWQHVNWQTILYFAVGAVIGVIAGALFLVQLPASLFQFLIASFVLYLCWGPALPGKAINNKSLVIVGGVTSFLTLFVGATGPLVSAFLKQRHQQRFTMVATIATALSLQHLVKIIVFALLGFYYSEWLFFIMAMILSGFLGTKLGLKQLKKFSDKSFNTVFNTLLTVLALYLLFKASQSLW